MSVKRTNIFISIMRLINKRAVLLLVTATVTSFIAFPQKISFGIFADPVISWFSTDTRETSNEGVRAGFNFGFVFNKYFSPNYAFSTGINILTAGGRLKNLNKISMDFENLSVQQVPAGTPVIYKLQYLGIPVGLKLKTNQIGYLTFFTDFGADPKILIGGKADVKALNIKGENIKNELNKFVMSYHIMAGAEYSLGGTTAIITGLGFDSNFLDVTNDINDQPDDNVLLKCLRFRLGVIF
jgi:hypothetical protein